VEALDLVKNIVTLHHAQELLEEVIMVNNASTENYDAVRNFIAQHKEINFRFIDAPDNLGVAKGRNFAIQYAHAPILILLDDDAEMQEDALDNIMRAFKDNESAERPVGIVTFKVIYFHNRQVQVNAFPHKQYHKYKDRDTLHTYYYAGGAHAIKKEVLDKVGQYPADFFYGMEEYDLSYRVLDMGYSILYDSSIVMLHKESPLGRKPKNEKVRMMWVNKSKVAWRYLPKKYFYSTAFMWSLQYLKMTGGNLSGFFKGWKDIANIPGEEKRTTVNTATLNYLRSVEARLWY
jgi:GT2 family glycosyltransferase